MSEEKKEVVFGTNELTPAQKLEYAKRIDAAKNQRTNSVKGSEPLGSVPRPVIPDFSKVRQAKEGPSPITEDGGVAPRPAGAPLLRPETEQQLKDVIAAQTADLKEEANKAAEEKKDGKKEDIFELFDFADQRNATDRIFDNKKRREEIEARCQPMKFEDLLYKGEVEQKVPIIPGKFEPTYRSVTPEESLFIKRYISKENESSDQYLFEKYNLCLLTCSLVAINDKPLPDHRGTNGDVDEKLFEAKFKMMSKKSGYIVSDLGVNYVWFDVRVRKLITADGLKNG